MEDFTVHEALIRKESPFFEAAMARDWKEASTRLVIMEEDTPDVFRLYINWIYTHRIYIEPLPTQVSGQTVPARVPSSFTAASEILEHFRARQSLLVALTF